MSRKLPDRPSLDHLRKQAKDRLPELLLAKPTARLADAQHLVAREYGFLTWAALKEEVHARARSADPFAALVTAVQANSPARARDALAAHPSLRTRLSEGVPAQFGATPLILAVHTGNRGLVDVLLEAGADINARSDWWAGSFGVLDDDHGLAPYLIERGATVTAHAAARLGMIDRLRDMLGTDPTLVDARGGDGQMPLHFASTVEIAQLLLEHGADIDARCVDHESTAAQWMLGGRHEVARYLVSRGCHTDILMAAALGDFALAQAHVAANPAWINMSVSERWFPKQNPRSGGTIYIWTLGWNKTPETVARKFGHSDIEAWARDLTRGQMDPMRLVAAATDDDASETHDLLERGWPVASSDENGTTALHWAGFHGNLVIAEALIARGAPVEARERRYNGTAVNWCIHGSVNGWHRERGDYAGVMAALLKAGAALPDNVADMEMSEAVRRVIRNAG